jgi:hypothetical protein
MTCANVTKETWKHLAVFSTDAEIEPFTEWMPCEGIDTVRAVMKIKASNGSPKVQLAMQCAAVRPSNPTAWQALGSYSSTGDREVAVEQDVAATTINTAANFWVRFGLLFKIDSGTIGGADCALSVSYDQCGQVVGHMNQVLESSLKQDDLYVPVGPFIPILFADKVKIATILTSMVTLTSGGDTNALGVKAAWRTANTSPESPNAWSTTFSAGTNTERSADGEYDTGELTPSYSGSPPPMWVQFGLHFAKVNTSGSGPVTGTVSAVVSAAVAVRKT